MKVAIIMGSNSDWPILEPAEKTLKEFGVEVEVIVASAHRTPDVVHEFAAGARNRGVEAIIAAAGRSTRSILFPMPLDVARLSRYSESSAFQPKYRLKLKVIILSL